MFCPNCGKENAEKNMFCMFCGGKLDNVTAESVADILSAEEKRTSSPVQTAVKPDEAPAQTSQPAEPAFSVPTPGVIPQSGAGEPFVSAAPDTAKQAAPESAPAAAFAEVPLSVQPKPEKERRYYTGAHIAICLAVAGVMAAAAGIFAGLYFSVIL